MKSVIFSFLFFAMLLSSGNLHAQLSSLGLDRRVGGSNQFQPSKNPATKKEFDFVQASTDKMTKELNLDGFQAAACKNFIEEYKNAVVNIGSEEIPDEGKMEKMNKAKDKMESKIKGLLNKDQLELFDTLKNKTEKKSKKKGKDKNENSEPEKE